MLQTAVVTIARLNIENVLVKNVGAGLWIFYFVIETISSK